MQTRDLSIYKWTQWTSRLVATWANHNWQWNSLCHHITDEPQPYGPEALHCVSPYGWISCVLYCTFLGHRLKVTMRSPIWRVSIKIICGQYLPLMFILTSELSWTIFLKTASFILHPFASFMWNIILENVMWNIYVCCHFNYVVYLQMLIKRRLKYSYSIFSKKKKKSIVIQGMPQAQGKWGSKPQCLIENLRVFFRHQKNRNLSFKATKPHWWSSFKV